MKRVAVVGAAVALAYVGVVIATSALTDRDVRPLFDAAGPSAPYRWVDPPPDFSAGNITPKPAEVPIGLHPDDVPPAGASEDSQFVFNLPKGAIAANGKDERAVARIVPLDPDDLGPPPAGKFADGNAYRVTFRYEPSGDPAPPTAAGTLLLTVPVPADGVAFSEDGTTWRLLKAHHVSATAVGSELPGAGHYLALTPDAFAGEGGGGGTSGTIGVVLITVGIAALLVGTPILRRRRR